MTGNDDQNQTPGRRNPWAKPVDQRPDEPMRGPNRYNNQGGGPDLGDWWDRVRPRGGAGSGLPNIPLIIAGLAVLWLASGIFRVDSSENAVVQRFGAYTRTQVQPGLGYHMPWPVETVTKLNVTQDRRVQLGFTDANYEGQRRDVADESLMLTADANIVDIDVVVLWNIAEAEKFVFNIRDPETTIKRVAEASIREAVGQTRLQSIITQGRDDLGARIQKSLQAVLDSYQSGVSIRQVLIQEATVHPEVLDAYNDVAASRQDAERFQNEATIYRNDIIPKARGQAIKMLQDAEAYKQDVTARAQGDARRFTEMLAAYNTGKDVTRDRLYIDTMSRVLEASKTRVIVDQKPGSQGVVPVLPLETVRPQSQPDTSTPSNPGQ